MSFKWKSFTFMETLAKLFGSETKVKVMKLFLFNPQHVFLTKEIVDRVKSSPANVRRELLTLEKMRFIKRRTFQRKNKNSHGYSVQTQFPYLSSLQTFLLNSEPLNPKELIRKISKIGNIKLIIVSGIFIQDPASRADILIVGDNVRKSNLENVIKNLEAEVGRELKYAYFTTDDFKYRLSMFDKLIRDILDYPHKVVLNKLSIL